VVRYKSFSAPCWIFVRIPPSGVVCSRAEVAAPCQLAVLRWENALKNWIGFESIRGIHAAPELKIAREGSARNRDQ
jgi:hypothetical protein